ncbi:MAG: flagellar hook-basal body complex protein FliE [Planctomycetes bacterium]|nr:flagellar hook-basal body complex protein FliE [Planctomycetota bacterium]
MDDLGIAIQGPGGGNAWRTLGPATGPGDPLRGAGETGTTAATGRSGFAAKLTDALAQVDALQDRAGDRATALARGEPVELHDVLVAMDESDVAFRLLLEVRNRLLDAWQTLTRTPI